VAADLSAGVASVARKIIDYKSVDMTDDEVDYYNQLVAEFTNGTYSGKEQFRGLFETDGDGCITIIHPPLKKQVGWAVILFMQNLMINQRLRRMERWVKELKDDSAAE
jgi:hypothetical protein